MGGSLTKITRKNAGLLVVDAQEKLFPYVENSCYLLKSMIKAITGLQILRLPIFVTEQYPSGLGETLPQL